jgi:hypothetical protein
MLLSRGYAARHLRLSLESGLLQGTPISLGLYELKKRAHVGAETGTRWGRPTRNMRDLSLLKS